MSNELKPCPFCGTPVEVDEDKFIRGDSLFRIECMGCGIHSGAFDDKNELIEVWNRRVDDGQNL